MSSLLALKIRGQKHNPVFQNCRQPLHWACSGGHRDVVAFILNCCLAIEGTIDVNTPDDVSYLAKMRYFWGNVPNLLYHLTAFPGIDGS